MMDMDVDAALTEVPVNLVPLTDDTDFKTIETAVAYNAAGMALNWHFVTTAGVETTTAVTPTTAGTYDWAHAGQGMYTIEIPASGGASINNDTEGFGYFTGYATGVLPWRGPTIRFRAAGLNDLMTDSAYSTTRGLAGTALPAAAADAAGGLPISDAGGLDLDAKLANTNEVTAARMGALTDWINGGRLDLLLDAIKAVTDALPNAGALTDLATAANLATLTAYVDTEVAAIKAKTDNLPSDPADESLIIAATNALAALLGTPAGVSVSADIAAVKVDTGTTIPGRIPAALTADGNMKSDALRVGGTLQTAGDLAALLVVIDDLLDTEIATILAAVDTEVAAIVTAVGTTLPAQIAALNNLSAAQVNAEVLDVLNVDTFAESSAVPAATATLIAKIGFIATLARNKQTRTSTTATLLADNGTTTVASATLSDDGTTFTRTEWV